LFSGKTLAAVAQARGTLRPFDAAAVHILCRRWLPGLAAGRRPAAWKKGENMPQFLQLGDLWINVCQITEVHVEASKDGTPAGCRIKLMGEPMRELSDAALASQVLAFLQANDIKPLRRKEE
jgi:hypothetical protein